MSAERRLSKRHATVMLALHQSGQELQRKQQELQETIDEMITEWLPVYGMDPEQQHRVEGRPDGELYLIELPKPAETAEEHHDERV